MRLKHYIPALAFMLPSVLAAQTRDADTLIKDATIEIIQSYKPEVKQAPKANLVPNLPPVDTTTPILDYSVPTQTLSYSYSSLPLRPLALTLDTTELEYPNYVKLGGGNLSTIYLDAGIGGIRGENYETVFQVHHLSQNGAINEQKVSLTGLDADGTYHKNGKAYSAHLDVNRNQYHYYGYDHGIYNYDINAIKQAFTNISLGVEMQNGDNMAQLQYNPSISGYYYGDSYSANETSFNISIPVSYRIDDKLTAFIGVNAAFTKLNTPLSSQSNNILQLAPGINFSTDAFTLKAGFYPTLGENKTYLLPDIDIRFTIPETQFIINTGYKGLLVQNTFRDLTRRNPFIYNTYTVNQTNTNEIYGNIKSNIGNNITFNGRVSWWQYNNLPVFINDTAFDNKQFNILYDPKVNALSLQASIRYQVAESFAIGLSGQWFNFYNKSFNKLWHRPGINLTGDISVAPVEKLTVTAYISFIDELYALDKGDRTLKLNSILDIGAGAEYEIIKRLNLFLQANNLLNSNYQRWYGYDAFGFNIFGGARLKF